MDFDKEHIKRIIQLEYYVNQLFNEFLNQVAPHLAKIKYGAGRGVWSKNRRIERQVDEVLGQFAAKYKALLQAHMQKSWEFSEQKNDELIMKLIKGSGVVVSADLLLKIFNRKATGSVDIKNIMTMPRRMEAAQSFMKNRLAESISNRVWDLSKQNKSLILKTVQSGVLEGRSASAISRDLRKLLNNPDARFRRVRDPKTGKLKLSRPMASYHPGQGVYRSAYKNAVRLARTETNAAYRRSDHERWRQTDFVLGYDVKRSHSGTDCDICDALKGRYPKTFVFTGWHAQCLCFAVPVLPSHDKFVEYLETNRLTARPVQGIPGEASRWVSKNSEKILAMKKRPYWIQDNFSIKNGEIKLNIN